MSIDQEAPPTVPATEQNIIMVAENYYLRDHDVARGSRNTFVLLNFPTIEMRDLFLRKARKHGWKVTNYGEGSRRIFVQVQERP